MSYARDQLIPLTDAGLGNAAYLATPALAVLAGGPQDWAGATGQPLQEGP